MNKSRQSIKKYSAIGLWVACGLACGCLHAAGVSCSVRSAALAFPPYDTFGNFPTDGVGTVAVHCVNLNELSAMGTQVALTVGTSANGSSTDRRMASTGSSLRYGLYSDAGRSQHWGDGSTAPQLNTGNLPPNQAKDLNFTLYGRVPAMQDVTAGVYTDTVFITITP